MGFLIVAQRGALYAVVSSTQRESWDWICRKSAEDGMTLFRCLRTGGQQQEGPLHSLHCAVGQGRGHGARLKIIMFRGFIVYLLSSVYSRVCNPYRNHMCRWNASIFNIPCSWKKPSNLYIHNESKRRAKRLKKKFFRRSTILITCNPIAFWLLSQWECILDLERNNMKNYGFTGVAGLDFLGASLGFSSTSLGVSWWSLDMR